MTPVLNLLTVCCWLAGGYAFFRGVRCMVEPAEPGHRLVFLRRSTISGLSLVMLGLALQAEGWAELFKLGLIWWLSLLVTAALLQSARREAMQPPPG